MLNGFWDFILCGNVVDLVVGVVIGVVFNNVVVVFIKVFFDLLICLVMGGYGKVVGIFVVNGIMFDWGIFVFIFINFLLIVVVLYFFVVMFMNVVIECFKCSEKVVEVEFSNEEKLLVEICDVVRSCLF